MTTTERRFAETAVRRKSLFRTLSVIGVVVGVLLAVYYGYARWRDPGLALGPRLALIVFVLLNARQMLRQHKYATILEKLTSRDLRESRR